VHYSICSALEGSGVLITQNTDPITTSTFSPVGPGSGRRLDEMILALKQMDCLLVLDGCERALNACVEKGERHPNSEVSFRKLLSKLLEETDKLKLLVTSPHCVGSLHNFPEKTITLEGLELLDSAKLFRARAPKKILIKDIDFADAHKVFPPKWRVVETWPDFVKRNGAREIPVELLAKHPIFKYLSGHPYSISLTSSMLQDASLKRVYDSLVSSTTRADSGFTSFHTSLEVSIQFLLKTEKGTRAVALFDLMALFPGGILEPDLNQLWGENSPAWTESMDLLLAASLVRQRSLGLEEMNLLKSCESRFSNVTQQYATYPCVLEYARRRLSEDDGQWGLRHW
jgi:hypothetical protein